MKSLLTQRYIKNRKLIYGYLPSSSYPNKYEYTTDFCYPL